MTLLPQEVEFIESLIGDHVVVAPMRIITFSCSSTIRVYVDHDYLKPMPPYRAHRTLAEAIASTGYCNPRVLVHTGDHTVTLRNIKLKRQA